MIWAVFRRQHCLKKWIGVATSVFLSLLATDDVAQSLFEAADIDRLGIGYRQVIRIALYLPGSDCVTISLSYFSSTFYVIIFPFNFRLRFV